MYGVKLGCVEMTLPRVMMAGKCSMLHLKTGIVGGIV
jgi:hypothetical protein